MFNNAWNFDATLILKESQLNFRLSPGFSKTPLQLFFFFLFFAGSAYATWVRCPPPKMEALGGYPAKSSNPKARKLTVLLSMTVGVGCLFLLQTQLAKPRKPKDFYSFEVKDAKGRTVSLEKYRGKVSPHHHGPSHIWPDFVPTSRSLSSPLGFVLEIKVFLSVFRRLWW